MRFGVVFFFFFFFFFAFAWSKRWGDKYNNIPSKIASPNGSMKEKQNKKHVMKVTDRRRLLLEKFSVKFLK